MKQLTKIMLKSGKEASPRRFHPWIFSGAIKKIYGAVTDGDIVEVVSNHDEFLGMGHYQDGSIAVRIISFEKIEPNQEFWFNRIKSAYDFRKAIGLVDNKETNCYRLVHAEGDGLPGLIIDFYNGTAVMQAHSVGMYEARNQITEALKNIYGETLKAVYNKSSDTIPKYLNFETEDGYLYGESEVTVVVENGCKFNIEWETGQKTGFFIDQRDNRELLAKYSKGRKVLNTYCYTGGFSVYALKAGAELVHSVDSSKKAIELTDKNIELNDFPSENHKSFAIDTMQFLNEMQDDYDLIILDPPAFAKHQNVRHNAVVGYKRINAQAIKMIKSGGILFTFSCSQVVDRKLFESTVSAAAIQSGRKVKVLHHLSQPADHAVSAFHPEGEYLKGLVLFVE
ncbi:MAG: class I SAM-dependent rRNA methyltransferase [Saprospiraceae bacterium]|nr:class I SAM-dependent rRNA methyltransferase [Saprospiraceae bacterium]